MVSSVGSASPVPSVVQDPAPVVDRGYIKRTLVAIKDLIVWLFQTIFPCFKAAKPAPVLPPLIHPVAPPAAPPIDPVAPPSVAPIIDNPHQNLLKRLPYIKRGEDIWKYFMTYFPTEEERVSIYAEIGKAAGTSWIRSYEAIGKGMTTSNPQLLTSYLLTRIAHMARAPVLSGTSQLP